MGSKFTKFTKSNLNHFISYCIIIIIGLLLYSNQVERYWSFSDLSQYKIKEINFQIYDYRGFGGVNYNFFNLLSFIELKILNFYNNQQFISFLIFSLLAYLNYYYFQTQINNANKNTIDSILYAINPFTVLSYSNISGNIYQFYCLVPIVYLVIDSILKGNNKIFINIILLGIQFHLIYLHPSFLIVTLYIISIALVYRLCKDKDFKRFLLISILIFLSFIGVLIVSVIGLIDPIISKNISSKLMYEVFKNNSIDFLSFYSLDRYPTFKRFSNLAIFLIFIISIFHIIFHIKIKENEHLKKYIIYLLIISFLCIDLYYFNDLRNFLFSNIIFLWPFRTTDKLQVFTPFLLLLIFNNLDLKYKKININLLKILILILCITESIRYINIDSFKNESLSQHNINFNSIKSKDLEQIANYIDADKGYTLILSSRDNPELNGWVDLPEIHLLGKHPFFDLLSSKALIDEDCYINLDGEKLSIRNILETNDAKIIYNLLRLQSFKYIFIDKYADLKKYNINNNLLNKLLSKNYIEFYYENSAGIVFKLKDPLSNGYYLSHKFEDIFIIKNKKLKFKRNFEASNNNNMMYDYYVLNEKYSIYWLNKINNTKSQQTIFNTNIFFTNGLNVEVLYLGKLII